VLANLIENALRHSPRGAAVVIEVATSASGVEVAVEDRGPGVPAELRPRLFDKFVQGHGRSGRLGLGLHFCAIAVRGWGGEIGYAPAASGGARFWLRLVRPRGVRVVAGQGQVDPG
jgi:K+-sensing histidine kinase KdpD